MPRETTRQASAKKRLGGTGPIRPVGSVAEQPASPAGNQFPVAVIGASAGGLEAFTALLKGLPSGTGMAFVLIQHLEPSHESALATILSKATSMPVFEVSSGIIPKPDHVYVIPPNKSMTLRKGALRLAPRVSASVPQHPIDRFAVSLAEERGSAAIGVILSGTGSDGTQGLKAIKAAGGITFAQDPKTTQWPGMPVSSISAGAADSVLSPRRIAAELARVGRHPYLVGVESDEIPEDSDLDKICIILRSSTGVDLRLYKQATVRRRIARRMALQQITTLKRYAQMLKRDRDEAQSLADDIFIHVTGFFRDPECFEALQKRVLTKLRIKRTEENPIRIWVAGCSTGEEAYSIAIILLEELGEASGRNAIQIFGTDISERAIGHARAGIYSRDAVAGVSPLRLKRFFTQTDHKYQINKNVRDLCVFARHDIAKDPPFSRLDLLSCRNALIYMGPQLQKRVMSVFQYAIKPGGFLFLGSAESISQYSDIFAADDRKHRIFLRKPAIARFRSPGPPADRLRERSAPAQPLTEPRVIPDFRSEAERLLLQHYTPPALVVDPDLHIVHFQGDTSPYLAPATGQPSFHLLKMVRPEFVVDLRAAIHKARRHGIVVHTEGVHFEHAGRSARARLEVRPLRKRSGEKQDFLVVFQKMETAAPEEVPQRAGTAARGRKVAERKTGRELTATREHLRALIEDHETAQEEMRAANEEVLSTNEELQSTNEELETTKEELQSTNEELVTLNDELRHRNSELSVLTNDLTNLLVSVDVPVLVLDARLHIRRFTPVAGKLFNLIPGDIGRPFSNFASTLQIADWDELFAEVTAKGRSVEQEVTDRKSHHRYSLRVKPYKTTANEIAGVMVVLLDTESIHIALDESRRTGDYARAIVETIREGLVVLDSNLCVVTANRSFTELFCCSLQDVQHRPLFGTGAGQIEAPPLRKLLRNVLKAGAEVRDFELDQFASSGPLHVLVNARLIETSATILLVVQDVSTRKHAQKELDKVEAALREQRTLLEKTVITAPGAVYAVRQRPDGSLSMPYAAPSFARMIPELPDVREDLTPLFEMMHPDDVDRVRASITESARTLKPWREEYRLVTPNRGTLWFEGSSVAEREPDGSIQWYGFLTEITDRKRIEQELIQSRQQRNSMLDNSPYAIARFDRDLRYRYVNARLLEAAGTQENSFIGKRIDEMGLPSGLVETWRSSLSGTFDTGHQAISEFAYPSPGGETYWESRVVPEFGLDGSVQSVLSFSVDVTERRKAESALRRSDERLRLAIESTEMGIFEANYLTGEINWSDIAKRQYGLPPDADLNTEQFQAMVHPDDRERVTSTFAPRKRSKQPTSHDFTVEYRAIGADEKERWLSSWGRVFYGKDGRPTRSIGVRLDITEHKRMEEALREKDAITANLFDAAAQGIVAVDKNGIVQLVNSMTTNLFGYQREEIVGQPLTILIPEAVRARHVRNHASYFDAPKNRPMGLGLHLSARHKNGSTFPVEVGLSLINTSEGSLAVAFVTDITERRRLEQVAREHADEVQALAASLLTAQEDERRRVSRELHDQICQQLASLAMDAGSLAAEGELPQTVQKRMKELQSRAVRASEETRHIAYQLHPSVIDDLGVSASLRELCRDFSRETDVRAEFNGNVQKHLVPREIASCLYRVTQEGLHNIAKHSGAKHVTVELAARKGYVELSVHDDGAGFDYAAVKGRGGLGLIGMEERARLVNGKLSITGRDGSGTHIFLAVPLPAAEL